jgi:beta-galactosidase
MCFSRLISVSLIPLSTFFLGSTSVASYAPPQTPRAKLNMNQNWKFNRSNVTGAEAVSFNDASWSTVHLPHNFQDVPITGGNYYRGVGFYRKHFTLDPSFEGKQITIYFEGAMTVAEFWINGTKLATHYGGFSPFCYDITEQCNYGTTENVIAVRLTNAYQNQVPPEKPDGSSVDFEMYGGIYRDVWLIATDKVFVPEGIHAWANNWNDQGGHFITFSSVSTSSANVTVRTWVKNASAASVSGKVVTTIVNAQNKTMQTSESTAQSIAAGGVTRFAQNITVSNPSLWYPWAPYLYTVHTVVYNGTEAVDVYSTKIGIRSIQFTRTAGTNCNNVTFKLLGLNRHQTWAFVGHAVPNIQQRRDAEILKEVGCNFVRCSHYLQDEAFMNACDSLGILIWVETPGWHCCNNNGRPSTDATWRNRHYDETRFMVRSARNHACVAIWAPAINEAVSDPTIEEPLNDLCHQEDSSRMTSAARAGWQHPTGAGSNIYDVYGDNQFTPGSIPTSNPDNTTYGYINTEHTGHTYEDSSRRETCQESALLNHSDMHMWMTDEQRSRGAWVHGGLGWCAFDYYTGGVIRYHGVMDLMHYPKFAFWFYKSQCAADNYDGSKHPMVKIANWYRQNSPAHRRVFHNCDQVRLYRGTTLIGTQGPDAGITVAHPQTTFNNVTWQTGTELRAEGLIGSNVVARDTARIPGTAAAIRLTADPVRIEANGGDFSRVVADIVDVNGTHVPYSSNSVRFAISGPGTLVGNNPFTAQSGVAMNLAKAQLTSGTITVTATATNLTQGTATIQVVAPATPVLGRPIALKPVSFTIIPSEKVLKTWSTSMSLGRLTHRLPVKVMVYDLNGRLLYQTITAKPMLNLSQSVQIPHGIKIVQVRHLSQQTE